MTKELSALAPMHKFDIKRAEAVITLGYPAVAPIIPDLLEWLQDMNWPVAQELAPFLTSIGAALAEPIRNILTTDDSIWKYWILRAVVLENAELARAIEPDLRALLDATGTSDDEMELKYVIIEILGSTCAL